MTKLQKLFQIAKGFDKENNYEKFKESVGLIKIELKKILKKIKSDVIPLEPLTIENFKASRPLTSPFLNNTFRTYDDKMFEVQQIFEKEGISLSLEIQMTYCDQYNQFMFSDENGDYNMDGSEFEEIDFVEIVDQIYDYLNIYPALVLLGAYEVANNEEYESLKVYDFEWD